MDENFSLHRVHSRDEQEKRKQRRLPLPRPLTVEELNEEALESVLELEPGSLGRVSPRQSFNDFSRRMTTIDD